MFKGTSGEKMSYARLHIDAQTARPGGRSTVEQHALLRWRQLANTHARHLSIESEVTAITVAYPVTAVETAQHSLLTRISKRRKKKDVNW